MDQAISHSGGESKRQPDIGTWPPEHSLNRWLKLAPGYVLAAAGLIWVLDGFHLGQLRGMWVNLKWKFLVAALLCEMLSYFGQGWRWQLLLRPLGKIPVTRVTQSLFAGLFINEVAPMRLGELARGYLVARWMDLCFARVFPTVLIERLFDGVWLAVGISLTALFIPLAKSVLVVRDVLCAVVGVSSAALVYFVFVRPRRAEAGLLRPLTSSKAPNRARSFLTQLREDLRFIGFRQSFYTSFVVSLLTLLLRALAFWLMLRSYGVALSFRAGAAVFMIVLIGTALPGLPGNLGTWQLACVFGMTRFGVSKALATGFSFVAFAILTAPLLVVGFVSLSRSGTTLLHLRQEINGWLAR